MLVLDDLQWADRGSLLLLRHWQPSRPRGSLVLATFRDAELARLIRCLRLLGRFVAMAA